MQRVNTMTRGGFLAGAALAGLPLILPSRLFGATSPSNTLNVGILGCGVRSLSHISSFMSMPGVRIIGVCDVAEKSMNLRKQAIDQRAKNQDCKTYRDYRELIANPEIDIVTIAAPDHWHALMAIEAAQHGKHIYLEKPFAYSIEEGRAVIEAVKQAGVQLLNGTQQRSNVYFQRAAYLARHGYLGEVHTVYAISQAGPTGGISTPSEIPSDLDFDFFTGPAHKIPYYKELTDRGGSTPGWYFNPNFCSGWVTAWGAHHVDSAMFALGKDHEAPIKVEARGSYPITGAFSTANKWTAEISYSDGKKLIFLTADQKEAPVGNVYIAGSKGWASATRGSLTCNPPNLTESLWPHNDPEFECLTNGGDGDHFRNLINIIRYGAKNRAPMEISHLSTTICHLTSIGIELQRPLQWNGKTERFINDDYANRWLGRAMRAPWKI